MISHTLHQRVASINDLLSRGYFTIHYGPLQPLYAAEPPVENTVHYKTHFKNYKSRSRKCPKNAVSFLILAVTKVRRNAGSPAA